ncbi:MAG: hypothetical protein NTV21_10450 [Planctomycetota bacterium]|nr:hypothetical protein [Planctomycetota bacterium]
MENNTVKFQQSDSARARERKSTAEERARLIGELERAWIEEEAEVRKADEEAAAPHGLFGLLGFRTSTG